MLRARTNVFTVLFRVQKGVSVSNKDVLLMANWMAGWLVRGSRYKTCKLPVPGFACNDACLSQRKAHLASVASVWDYRYIRIKFTYILVKVKLKLAGQADEMDNYLLELLGTTSANLEIFKTSAL